ncbi:MAG: lysophospholipid acyltransferase family protein [Candidatus Marinimicrobia bacterium]|nr:lysophospholipid acyltransferase family protein [Candidatus Neomarinimicrobiota bacterium]MCF7827989.1 lysophospholipid acyltransferase family protein [Candidatus Neomarinimicrobiota bacterium]MCF7879256.1 lysophospholipid acyltransferase family protein [Candidatus Neomarinimicrobiota bacterium]
MAKSLWKQTKFYAGVTLGGLLIRSLFTLSRNKLINESNFTEPLESGRNVVLAIWHGQMLPIIYNLRNRGIYAMVGYHRDAEMIARVLNRLGFYLVRGSSRDRGKEAMSRSLEIMNRPGSVLGITCDGPIGPYREVKPGVGVIAHKTGSVVVPVAANSTRKKVIKSSWDSFYLPLPFGRNRVVFGEPIYPEDFSGTNPVKSMLEEIETRLNTLQTEEDRRFGAE